MLTSKKKLLHIMIVVCILLFGHCVALAVGYHKGYVAGRQVVYHARWRQQRDMVESVLRRTNLRDKLNVNCYGDGTVFMAGSLTRAEYTLLKSELTETLAEMWCTFALQDVEVIETRATQDVDMARGQITPVWSKYSAEP